MRDRKRKTPCVINEINLRKKKHGDHAADLFKDDESIPGLVIKRISTESS
jgi:hypothetical protein